MRNKKIIVFFGQIYENLHQQKFPTIWYYKQVLMTGLMEPFFLAGEQSKQLLWLTLACLNINRN